MPALATFDAVLASYFEDKIVNQMNRSVPTATLLDVAPGQGKNIQWDIRTGTGVGAPIADGADAPAAQSDTKSAAKLDWAIYTDVFSITGLAYHAAAAAGNPAELGNLFTEEMMESVQRLAQRIGTDMWLGDPTASPRELSGLIDPTNGALKATGSYAGINKGVVTQFAGNELLNGGVPRALAFDLLRAAQQANYEASGYFVDFMVASPKQWSKLGQLYDDKRRYVDQVRLAKGVITLDAGFKALEFDGIPVFQDKNLDDDKIVGLNSEMVKWKALPNSSNAAIDGMGMQGLKGSAEYQRGDAKIPLSVRILPLARTGDNYKFQLLVYCQIQVKRPNSCFILGDLN